MDLWRSAGQLRTPVRNDILYTAVQFTTHVKLYFYTLFTLTVVPLFYNIF